MAEIWQKPTSERETEHDVDHATEHDVDHATVRTTEKRSVPRGNGP